MSTHPSFDDLGEPRLAGSRNRPERRHGAVMAMVLIVMVVLGLLGAGMLNLSSVTALEAGRSVAEAQAFWTAEAGLAHVQAIAQKIRKPLSSVPYAASPTGCLLGSNVVSGNCGGSCYAVSITDDTAWTNSAHALKKYVIRSVGISTNGAQQVVTLGCAIQSFASYLFASNFERSLAGNPIWFWGGDTIDGPVYTNDRLNIDGSSGNPRFLQMVSSAASSVNYSAGGTVAAFQDGLTLNATPLDISGEFTGDHITEIQNAAASGGLTLTNDYVFTFNADGSFNYNRTAPTNAPVSTNYLAALNGTIYVNGNAYIKGTVNGNVTLAAQQSIYISNSIVYASAISPAPWATNFVPANVDDTLGLIASNRIEIMGTSAINIDATIMVTSDDPTGNGGFRASAWNQSIGNPNINLYGGVTQYRRGVVGQVGGNGFNKNYKFDSRFVTEAPPHFPYSVYVFTGWKQSRY